MQERWKTIVRPLSVRAWQTLLAAAVMQAPAHGQPPAVAAPTAETAASLVEKNIRARGGAERIRAVKSARATGSLSIGDDRSAPFTYEWRQPNFVRLEFVLDGETSVQAYDGMSAWAYMPFLGHPEAQRLPRKLSEIFELQSDFAGPLFDYAKKGHGLSLKGRVTHSGHDTWQLLLELGNGAEIDIYLHPTSYLEVAETLRIERDGTTLEVEVELDDYREVAGLVLAQRVTSRAAGSTRPQSMKFETVELNVAIATDRFTMPRPAAASAGATAGD